MANIDNAISDALGLTKNIKEQILDPKPIIPRPQQAVVPAEERNEDIDSDYKYSRENFYNLIERGQDAITGILDLAKEQEHPRTYEVAGQLIKSVSDATDKLMDLQKKLKDVEEDTTQKGPSTVNNALFVGSTADLAKLIKGETSKKQ